MVGESISYRVHVQVLVLWCVPELLITGGTRATCGPPWDMIGVAPLCGEKVPPNILKSGA